MDWDQAGFKLKKVIRDTYFFAGRKWSTQQAKRFIVRVGRIGQIIEASYYIHLDDRKKIVNIAFEPSASYGCPISCLFCASGSLSPVKSLNTQEIANQLLVLIDDCMQTHKEIASAHKYVFYTGIGEPTLMPDQLITASKIVYRKHPDLSFKLSTMGAVPGAMIQFAKSNLPLRSLQLTLPHWNEKKLKHLFSKCDVYNLSAVLNAVKEFSILQPRTKIKFNYIGIKGYNDSTEDLKKTVDLIHQYFDNRKFELKISCLNPTEVGRKNALTPISQTDLEKLVGFASNLGVVNVYLFGPMSHEKIGCGQLVGDYKCKVS